MIDRDVCRTPGRLIDTVIIKEPAPTRNSMFPSTFNIIGNTLPFGLPWKVMKMNDCDLKSKVSSQHRQ
jgi:hypothetical protein